MSNSIETISAFATRLQVSDVPAEAFDLVKRAFLDTISVSLSGSRLTSSCITAKLAFAHGSNGGAASAIGHGRKANVMDAALLNGTAAHAELYDDNNKPMISHPSAPLVSALLPLGQARGKSGADVLLAYVIGFEVNVALGRQLNPGFYEAGWHVTRVLGVLGATAACARLIGLDREQCGAALGIAASLASGIRQNFGTMTMALHAGLAARDAIYAALMAEAGFMADADALDGTYGHFRLFAGKLPAALPLGNPFELIESGIIFKPYPSGAPTHAAVDAALALHQAIGGRADEIEGVRCLVHPWNFMTLREGTPTDTLRARVNLQYCIAASLRFGELTPAQFTEASLADPLLRAVMGKIEVAKADDLPDNGLFPAEVQVRLRDGRTLRERRDVPPGAPERPMTPAQAMGKFQSCARGILDAGVQMRIADLIARLETLPRVGELCDILEARAPA